MAAPGSAVCAWWPTKVPQVDVDQLFTCLCRLLSHVQERFYFGDGVLPLFESGIPLLLDRLKRLPDKDKVTQHSTQQLRAWH